MAYSNLTTSFHRHNDNGTFDSICKRCFLTIASVRDEQQLAPFERAHACNPIRLYQLQNGLRFSTPRFTPSRNRRSIPVLAKSVPIPLEF